MIIDILDTAIKYRFTASTSDQMWFTAAHCEPPGHLVLFIDASQRTCIHKLMVTEILQNYPYLPELITPCRIKVQWIKAKYDPNGHLITYNIPQGPNNLVYWFDIGEWGSWQRG